MSSEILQQIACPNCQSSIDLREHGQYVTCEACNSQFLLRGRLCPNCHRYHSQETAFCASCGHSLMRACLKCQTSNWAGDEYCANCGNAMDLLELMRVNQKAAREEFMSQRQENARRMKALEEEASQKRMADFLEMEQARQADLRRRLEKQRQQERRIFYFAVGLSLIFITLVALFVLMSS